MIELFRRKQRESPGEADGGGIESEGRRALLRGAVGAASALVLRKALPAALVGVGAVATYEGYQWGKMLLKDFKNDYLTLVRQKYYEGLEREDVMGREQAIEALVTPLTSFMQSEEGKRVLNEGTDDELVTLFSLLPHISRKAIEGTKFSIPASVWSDQVRMAGYKFQHGQFHVGKVGDSFADLQAVGIGNLVPLGDNFYFTNVHVARALLGSGRVSVMALRGSTLLRPEDVGAASPYDVLDKHGIDACIILNESYRAGRTKEDALDTLRRAAEAFDRLKKMSVSSAGISGSLVQIPSIDADDGAARDGTKLCASIAVPYTPRVAQFFGALSFENYTDLYMYLSPPGEQLSNRSHPRSGSHMLDALRGTETRSIVRAQGTSGSGVYQGADLCGSSFAGVHDSRTIGGVVHEIGFFRGSDEAMKGVQSGGILQPSMLE
jgi:hypothetical protein